MKKRLALCLFLIFLVALSACVATEPALKATMPSGEWDYIVLGDSITFGYPTNLKREIEKDYESEVSVKIDNWYLGGQSSSQLLESLTTDEELREAIRNAELITLLIPMGGCRDALITYENEGECGGDDNQDCLRACFANYKTDATAIFAELVNLRNPSEALIRAHDLYQFHTSNCQDNGTFDVINSYWLDANEHVHSTAESYNIPVAHVYDAFMGEDGTQPPEDYGLVRSDMVHTTQEGMQLIADLLHEFGYELAVPSQ